MVIRKISIHIIFLILDKDIYRFLMFEFYLYIVADFQYSVRMT